MQGPLKHADLAEKTDGLGFKLLLRGVQSRAKESVCHPEVSLEELEKPLALVGDLRGFLSAALPAAHLSEPRDPRRSGPWTLPGRTALPAGRNINMDEAWHRSTGYEQSDNQIQRITF